MNNHTDIIEENGRIIKVAIDMHLRSFRVVHQIGYQRPKPAQKFAPDAFYRWLKKQLEQEDAQIAVCYEAGCFGYEPARRIEKMGARVFVIAPQDWDEKCKRQVNDKHDAQVLCRRLHDFLCGHNTALSIVRVPSPEEEARRAPARHRDQLRRELRRMQAMGRSLLLQREMAVTGRWWNAATWKRIQEQMPSWVIEQLAVWKEIIELTERKARQIEAHLAASAPDGKLFHGEGKLTHELFTRELIDPNRFKNGRQVGNYFGLCPSESSSGSSRRLGSITKHGNPRLRWLSVQMAWRVKMFQPKYRGVIKWQPVIADKSVSPVARKKAIVALARRLVVDLWRIATGRVTAQELGLRLSPEQ